MTPDPEESEGSRVEGIKRREGEPAAEVEVVKSQKKIFVCPNCNQKKKSLQTSRSSEATMTTETGVRPSKSGSKVCKKCRKAAVPVATAPTTVEKKRRRSLVVFNPHWTHYCFLLAIYLVFSVILYFMTLKQQQSE